MSHDRQQPSQQAAIDTWRDRDLPLLRVAVRAADLGQIPEFEQLEAETGLTKQQVRIGVRALQEAGYVQAYFDGGMSGGRILSVTERGRRGAGAWPSASREPTDVLDHYFHNVNGTIIVREGSGPLPWLVTWLPNNESDPTYPGFTLSSTEGGVPIGPTLQAVAAWAGMQRWARRPNDAEPPPGAGALDIPPDEWHDLQECAFEHGVRLGFTREPDGSFSWGVSSIEGELLQHGVADSWDDTRLAMIENVYPPGEK